MKNLVVCDFLSILFLTFFCVSISSCDFGNLNEDPSKLSYVHPRLMLLELSLKLPFIKEQMLRELAVFLFDILKVLTFVQLGFTYNMNADQMNTYWNSMYTDVIGNCQVIEQDDAPNIGFYKAVAKLFQANAFQQMTLYFGEIPCTEVGIEGIFQPRYDTQETVMEKAMNLTHEAIDILQSPDDSYTGGDLIYDGNWDAWLKTAYGLQARFSIQKGNTTSSDYQEILQLVAQSYTSNEDNCSFQFEDSFTANWSLAKFAVERPSTIEISTSFVDLLQKNIDPRAEKYYFDHQWGFQFYNNDLSYPNEIQLIWGRHDALIPLLSYTELQFIKAECLARIGDDAQNALAEAIHSSMKLTEVVEEDATTYINSLSPLETLSSLEQIGVILEEAYKAYYGFNFDQSYNNYRRTGLPNIDLDVADFFATATNPTASFPERLLYTDDEMRYNRDNLLDAIERQNGATLDIPIWIFE